MLPNSTLKRGSLRWSDAFSNGLVSVKKKKRPSGFDFMISISVCVGFNETVDPSVRFQSIRENNGDKSVLNPIQETVACVNQRTQILAGKTEEKD